MADREETYLFIDGAYLRSKYEEAMQAYCGDEGELDPRSIRLPDYAYRAFFYDCLDESPKPDETVEAYNARRDKQQRFFDGISEVSGFHFRPGTLKGEKKVKRRQKEVDVQLAVDMLVHGFNKNMKKAILISGDLDFRPIIEELVRHGVFVEVWYEAASTPKELPMAADFGRPLTFSQLHAMGKSWVRAKYRLPTGQGSTGKPSLALTRTGKAGQSPAFLFKNGGEFMLWVEDYSGIPILFTHDNLEQLEFYLKAEFRPVVWD